MIAEKGIRRRHRFGGKAKRSEAIGSEATELIHARRIQREAIDSHHFAQHLEGGRQELLEESTQRGSTMHRQTLLRKEVLVNDTPHAPGRSGENRQRLKSRETLVSEHHSAIAVLQDAVGDVPANSAGEGLPLAIP